MRGCSLRMRAVDRYCASVSLKKAALIRMVRITIAQPQLPTTPWIFSINQNSGFENTVKMP